MSDAIIDLKWKLKLLGSSISFYNFLIFHPNDFTGSSAGYFLIQLNDGQVSASPEVKVGQQAENHENDKLSVSP